MIVISVRELINPTIFNAFEPFCITNVPTLYCFISANIQSRSTSYPFVALKRLATHPKKPTRLQVEKLWPLPCTEIAREYKEKLLHDVPESTSRTTA